MSKKGIFVSLAFALLSFCSCTEGQKKSSKAEYTHPSSKHGDETHYTKWYVQEIGEYLYEDPTGTLHITKVCKSVRLSNTESDPSAWIEGCPIKYIPSTSADPNAYYCSGCITEETYKAICIKSAPEWDGN